MLHYKRILFLPGTGLSDYSCFDTAFQTLKQQDTQTTIGIITNTKALHNIFKGHPNVSACYYKPDKKTLRALKQQYDCLISFPMAPESMYALRKLFMKTFFPAQHTSPTEALLEIINI